MISDNLQINEVPYLYDRSGRIWMKGDKVYRIIEDINHIKNYKELLNSDIIGELFAVGLVRTRIAEEFNAEGMMILEHQKIPFILHPCEYSNKMFWQAACMFIEVNLKLWEKGFVTHDSHPWNISFNGNKPIFYDFGSIKKQNSISEGWFEEFYSCFVVPIWLASFSSRTYKYSKEYRREHAEGFGLKLFKSNLVQKLIFRNFRNLFKLKNSPEKLFKEILNWLHKHEPKSAQPDYWSDYYKLHDLDFTNPRSIKQKFVEEILKKVKPAKVLDLASNKGYYASMASHLGASVLAFDYEEEIVNYLILNGTSKNNITPAHMDFNKPTAALGVNLFWQNSFYRFKSDIVLALGLIHHICITQNVPVFLFCKTCMEYADKGIILEFVDPKDIHVTSWNRKTPKDYSIERIKYYMSTKFPKFRISEIENKDGLIRYYMYFSVN